MNLTCCPICYSSKIKTVTGEISFKTPKGEITIPEVTRIKCDNCGEEFFNREANMMLDHYRGKIVNTPRKKVKKSLA